MTLQRVTVVRVEGEKPRFLLYEDAPNKDGSPSTGFSMIETLKGKARREELFSVSVEPAVYEAPPEMVAAHAAAKAAAAKKESAKA